MYSLPVAVAGRRVRPLPLHPPFRRAIRSPLNPLVCSSWELSFRPFPSLVAFLWTFQHLTVLPELRAAELAAALEACPHQCQYRTIITAVLLATLFLERVFWKALWAQSPGPGSSPRPSQRGLGRGGRAGLTVPGAEAGGQRSVPQRSPRAAAAARIWNLKPIDWV